MNIFLSVHYHLQTNLNKSEVINILKKNVDHESTAIEVGFGNSSSKRSIGKIKKDTFEARFALHYRNSFTPILFGKTEASNNESTNIFLKLRLHLGINFFSYFGFLCLWVVRYHCPSQNLLLETYFPSHISLY